jgi:GAF domain-containing protein
VNGLARAAAAIAAAPGSLPDLLQLVTELARELIGAHQSATSVAIDHDWAHAIHAVSLSDKYGEYRGYGTAPDGSGIYAVVCRENRPRRMIQAELEAHPAWRAFGSERQRPPPMRGWLAVPLVGADGASLGLIQLSNRYAGEFTADDEARLVQLAELASAKIERHRAALRRWGRRSRRVPDR